jgi:hypothetical protein
VTPVSRCLSRLAAWSKWMLFGWLCVIVTGCSSSDIEKVVVDGVVIVGGRKPESGEIRFNPIDGTPGPLSAATIENGHFRIESRGGVPVGNHRVEVDAYRKTGRKVPSLWGPNDMVDELTLIVPTDYTTSRSPLVVHVSGDTAKSLEIAVPAKH